MSGPARSGRDDTGATLMDVMVSTAIMSVVMAMATAGMVQLFRITQSTGTRIRAQSSVSLALMRLDRQIRYSSGIGATGPGGADHVEYEVVALRTRTCYQVRLVNDVLMQRSWTAGPVPQNVTAWASLASEIDSLSFTRIQPTEDVGHQRLLVKLSAGTTGEAANHIRANEITFTALNTGGDTPTANPAPCDEGQDLP